MAATRYEAAIEAARRLERELSRLLEADGSAAPAHLDEARVAFDGGRADEALHLLDAAIALDPEPAVRARIQHLRGRIETQGEHPLFAAELLVTEATAVELEEPETAVKMLVDAVYATMLAGDFRQAHETAGRARAIASRTAREALAEAELCLAVARLLEGDEGGEAGIRDWLEQLGPDADLPPDRWRHLAAVLFWVEEYDLARILIERLVARSRASMRYALPGAIDTLAAVDYRTGHWNAAEARSREALRLSWEYDQRGQAASCLTTLARIAAARGKEEDCRRRAAEALELVRTEDLNFAYAVSALGLLELGLGRVDAAIVELEKLYRAGLVSREPMIVLWLPDLVEAYVHTGRRSEAAEVLAVFEDQARGRRRKWATAAVSRCRGLLADGGAFENDFVEALDWHSRTPLPFERARTELCLGERLRRARRSPEARSYLLSALGTFERLGARPWAERARRELATRRSGRSADGAEALTAHEREVLALVARGATNREAAAALFVSPKTIEYHLASVFRKLDVRSRTELALRVREPLQ